MLISLLLGSIPTFIVYAFSSSSNDFFEKIKELIPSDHLHWYYIMGCLVFTVLSLVLRYVWLKNQNARSIVIFLREIFAETATGLRNIIQTMVGIIIALCLLWYLKEPQTFNIFLFVVYLAIGVAFAIGAAFLELVEKKTTTD
jgi:hypothetical protein